MRPISFQLLMLRSLKRRERCLPLPCYHVHSVKATVQDWLVRQHAVPSLLVIQEHQGQDPRFAQGFLAF